MKFIICFNRTALHMAVERKNVEIIKLLLSNPNIDISVENEIYYFYSFKVFLMNFMIFINIFL